MLQASSALASRLPHATHQHVAAAAASQPAGKAVAAADNQGCFLPSLVSLEHHLSCEQPVAWPQDAGSAAAPDSCERTFEMRDMVRLLHDAGFCMLPCPSTSHFAAELVNYPVEFSGGLMCRIHCCTGAAHHVRDIAAGLEMPDAAVNSTHRCCTIRKARWLHVLVAAIEPCGAAQGK